jgi:hypothetical protein
MAAMAAAKAHMTATTHREITALTARPLIGALLLGALIVMGVGLTEAIGGAALRELAAVIWFPRGWRGLLNRPGVELTGRPR